jgi:hypothetical protein
MTNTIEVPQIAVSSLVKTIKAHLEKAKQAQDRSEQHYISAGLHLAELKDRYKRYVKASKTQTWEQFARDTFGLGRSRADELIRIADGRATLDDTRAVKAASVAKSKAKVPKTAASSGGSGDIAEQKARLAGKDADAPASALADLSERIAYAETAAIADDGNGRMTVTIGDGWREPLAKSAEYLGVPADEYAEFLVQLGQRTFNSKFQSMRAPAAHGLSNNIAWWLIEMHSKYPDTFNVGSWEGSCGYLAIDKLYAERGVPIGKFR